MMDEHAKHLPLLDANPVAIAKAALSGPRLVDDAAERLAEVIPITRDPITREQRRSRRKREVRAQTISMKRLTKRELDLGRMLYPPDESEQRPQTRAECKGGERPCPFVSCAHHLYLDVSAKTGAIKLNFPDLEPHEMAESCTLDVADRGGETLEEVGAIMNITRERVRQLEVKALAKMKAAQGARLREHCGEGPVGKRRLPILDAGDEDLAPADPQHIEVGSVGETITDEFGWRAYDATTEAP